ncbi:hypothetical protein H7F10_07280 [Acidithiobacillus sp. HP-6]|uniref:hypothetical protein n=1 Tax=unclassified Acidithiobacillus TaxID=2614800 RepID=UPI00187ADB36|nr:MULTISPECIES: hypothetical protein [unclassified Acidithiobacillus]MBE7562755.1 hypothetical protein [Acidithiobacillus sp. HP-6]MBE7570830.1 hypothetical protein [Acidithiobacillus sp. HP-2]
MNEKSDEKAAEIDAPRIEVNHFLSFIIMDILVSGLLCLLAWLGPNGGCYLVLTGILTIAACLIFFILSIDMIASCRHKQLKYSAGLIMIQLFMLGCVTSALFIIIFALIYKIGGASSGKTMGDFIYNSAQYFYNTGATTNGFAGEMKYWQLSESMIGYSFYPAYIGVILYLFSTKPNQQEKTENPGIIKRFYHMIIDC